MATSWWPSTSAARRSRPSTASASRIRDSTRSCGVAGTGEIVPRRVVSAGPTTLRPVEPHRHRYRPGGAPVVGEHHTGSDAVGSTNCAEHHQVMAEATFGVDGHVLVHGLHDAAVVTLSHPLQTLFVGGSGLGRDDVDGVGGLVLGQLLE